MMIGPPNIVVLKPECNPAILRDLAFKVEEALDKTPKGVQFHRPQALTIKRALFELADKIEREMDACSG